MLIVEPFFFQTYEYGAVPPVGLTLKLTVVPAHTVELGAIVVLPAVGDAQNVVEVTTILSIEILSRFPDPVIAPA